jgi:hypothetical protein
MPVYIYFHLSFYLAVLLGSGHLPALRRSTKLAKKTWGKQVYLNWNTTSFLYRRQKTTYQTMDRVQNKPNSSVQHTPSSESFQVQLLSSVTFWERRYRAVEAVVSDFLYIWQYSYPFFVSRELSCISWKEIYSYLLCQALILQSVEL